MIFYANATGEPADTDEASDGVGDGVCAKSGGIPCSKYRCLLSKNFLAANTTAPKVATIIALAATLTNGLSRSLLCASFLINTSLKAFFRHEYCAEDNLPLSSTGLYSEKLATVHPSVVFVAIVLSGPQRISDISLLTFVPRATGS